MADPKKFNWATNRIKERKRFAELLADETLRREVFNEKHFDALERRRDGLVERERKVQMIQWTGVLLLALAVLSVHLPVSVFGLPTGDVRSAREIILLILSTVQLAALFPDIELANITDQLEALCKSVSKGDEVLRRALRTRYGLSTHVNILPTEGSPSIGLRQLPVLMLAGVGIIGWFLLTFIVFFAIDLIAMIDILRNPTVSTRISILVVSYVLLAFSANLTMRTAHGINPNQAPKDE